MVTVISRFRVRNGLEGEVRTAFLNRPRHVESAPGFRGIEVLNDAADPALFLLVTRWTDEAAFRAWHRSHAHHDSHRLIPKGLKLDPSYTAVTIAHTLEVLSEVGEPSPVHELNGVIEARTGALTQWLMQSESIFALALAPDGSIRLRNRAAHRVFPTAPAPGPDPPIWDYLVPSDAERLRQKLAAIERPEDCRFLLNLAHGEESPTTWEAGLVRSGAVTLLLGAYQLQHDAHLLAEILTLTSDLSLAMREAARKNRELKKAVETIDELARTDSLTGLANRRTLEEALAREGARADRLGEGMALIFLDLDRFKHFNDCCGHLAGDNLLVAAGAVLRQQLRPYDLAARFGGDEFVVLLPEASRQAAAAVAERIRADISALRVSGCLDCVSASIGVAAWTTGDGTESLIARADRALYAAKRYGGNRIEFAAALPISETTQEVSS